MQAPVVGPSWDKVLENALDDVWKIYGPELPAMPAALNDIHISIMMARVRSGTTLLNKFFSTHPTVRALPEIFLNNDNNRETWFVFWPFYRRLILRAPHLAEPVGTNKLQIFYLYLCFMRTLFPDCTTLNLDVKFTQLHNLDGEHRNGYAIPNLVEFCKKHNWSTLILERRNYLAQYISDELSFRNRKSADEKAYTRTYNITQIEIDTRLLLAHLRGCELEYTLIRRVAKQATNIYYEEFFDNDGNFAPAFAKKMAEYLRVDQKFDLKPQMKKLSPPPAQAITNYAEVKAALAATPHAWMLDSPL